MIDFAKYWQERRSTRGSRFHEPLRAAAGQFTTARTLRARRAPPPLASASLSVPSPTPSLFEGARAGESSGASILWVFARPHDERLFRLESFGSFLQESTLLLRLGDGARGAGYSATAPATCLFPAELSAELPAASSGEGRRWAVGGQRSAGRRSRVREALATLTSAAIRSPLSGSPSGALLMPTDVLSEGAPATGVAPAARIFCGPSLAELLHPAVQPPSQSARPERFASRARPGASAARRRFKRSRRDKLALPARNTVVDAPSSEEEVAGTAFASIAGAMLEALPQAAMLFSLAGGALLRANAEAERLLERPLSGGSTVLLRNVQLCRLDGEELPAARHPFARALADDAIEGEEFGLRNSEGRITPIELSVRGLCIAGERALLVVASDISSRKVRERMRAELTAMIAHDMRTPLHSILLQLDALHLRSEAETVPREALDRVRRNGKRLARMVEDLLDAARIENGRLHLEPETVELDRAVAELVGQIAPGLGSRILLVDVKPGSPAASVDLLRLQQVLTNLIENAAKYSPPETPIEVLVEPYAGGTRIAIRDHGDGIPQAQIPLVFERFFQVDTRQKRKGLGLGLYICRGLVVAQKGRIWLESNLGQGTTFSVWFPGATSQA